MVEEKSKMMEKPKSHFTTAAAIGCVCLALLGSPETVNAQWIHYPPGGWGYYRPPMYGYGPIVYGPTTVWQSGGPYIGGVPVGTGVGLAGGTGYGGLPAETYGSINETGGRRIIYNYLKRKKMGFKKDVSPRIRGTQIPYLRPDFRFDFQLINGLVIEYYSPNDELDSEVRKIEFERRKDAINLQLNGILEPVKWNWTLTEGQKAQLREELTFRYLNQLGVQYERDPNSARGFTIPDRAV